MSFWRRQKDERMSAGELAQRGAEGMRYSVISVVEKMENPFVEEWEAGHGGRYNGFERFRRDILSLLKQGRVDRHD